MVPKVGIGIFYTGDKDFRRIDSMRMVLSTDPLGLFNKLPVYGLGAYINDIKYMRYFEDAKKAKLAPPKIIAPPFQHKIVRNYMSEGEVYATSLKLNLAAGNTIPFILGPTLGYFHNNEIILSGYYDIEIQKLNSNRVRVRIRYNDYENASLLEKLSSLYLLTAIDVVNILVSNFIYLNIYDINVNKNLTHKRSFDYLFNFNNKEARDAYDLLFNKIKKLNNDFKLKCRNKKQKKIKDNQHKKIKKSEKRKLNLKYSMKKFHETFEHSLHKIITDTGPLEKIIQEDKNKPIEEQRIREIMNVHFDSNSNSQNSSLGLVLHQTQWNKTQEKYKFTDEDRIDKKDQTIFYVKTNFKGTKKVIGTHPNYSYEEEFLGVKRFKNSNKNKLDLSGRYNRLRFHKFKKSDNKKLFKYLKKNIPIALIEESNINDFFSINKNIHNFMIKVTVTFGSEYWDKVATQIPHDINYINQKFIEYSAFLKRNKIVSSKRKLNDNLIFFHKKYINLISTLIFKPEERTYKLWKKIVSHPSYKKFGFGFFWYLLKDIDLEEIKDFASVNLLVATPHRSVENFSYNFGKLTSNSSFSRASDARWQLFYGPRDYRELSD